VTRFIEESYAENEQVSGNELWVRLISPRREDERLPVMGFPVRLVRISKYPSDTFEMGLVKSLDVLARTHR
jgi:hypothetical protein